MKKIILITAILFVSMALFSQIRTDGIIEYRIDGQHLPYKIKPTRSSAKDGEIWRPLNSNHYTLPYPAKPLYENEHYYDTAGVWYQTISSSEYEFGYAYTIETGNKTFRKEGFDFPDTITRYRNQDGKLLLLFREYYDYHYYDRMPEDSFYYVFYRELWNDASKEWENIIKNIGGILTQLHL